MKQLQGLLSFIEIADAGTLAGAARRLGLTPAAVSKNLARLEDQLGVRLVQRSTRTTRLTAEGERFVQSARAALRALDEAVAEVSHAGGEAVGTVRVSVGASFGRHWVLPVLPDLVDRHPKLRVEVDLDNRPVDLVARGYDIGIRGGALPNSGFVARRACRLPLALVASPDYLRKAGVPRVPADLAQHRCVQAKLADGSPSTWHFRTSSQRRTAFVPPSALVVDDSEAVVALAVAGGGIAQSGLYHVLPSLREGRLKLVLPQSHDPGAREFLLLYPHREYLAPRVRTVVDALLEHFKASADLHLVPADLPASFHAR